MYHPRSAHLEALLLNWLRAFSRSFQAALVVTPTSSRISGLSGDVMDRSPCKPACLMLGVYCCGQVKGVYMCVGVWWIYISTAYITILYHRLLRILSSLQLVSPAYCYTCTCTWLHDLCMFVCFVP